jgi:3-deoxy-D-manno-octulosonic-acid transferase
VRLEISKRKLESYRRAEALAQELRYQMTHRRDEDNQRLCDFVISWMRSTGNLKYERPANPKGLSRNRLVNQRPAGQE